MQSNRVENPFQIRMRCTAWAQVPTLRYAIAADEIKFA